MSITNIRLIFGLTQRRQYHKQKNFKTMTNWELLTEKQRVIAELAAYQNTQKDIANALDISVFTVNNVMRRIYEKLETDEQGLFFNYFGVDPDSNPILSYDIRPKIKPIQRVGAVMLTALLVTQILSASASMLRPSRARADSHVRITRTRTTRTKVRVEGDIDLEFTTT